MVKVQTTVNYRVPDWGYCNCSSMGKYTKDKCRFCVKSGKQHVCALYNMPLSVEEGVLVVKTRDCVRTTVGFRSEVEDDDDVEDIQVDPKTVMKLTIKEYRKAYNSFVRQGYPDAIADKLAQQTLLG